MGHMYTHDHCIHRKLLLGMEYTIAGVRHCLGGFYVI